MDDHRRYIVSENIERFEALLRSGQLDRGQIDVVRALLAQARAESATLEQVRGFEVPARFRPYMPVAVARGGSNSGPVLRQSGPEGPLSLDQAVC